MHRNVTFIVLAPFACIALALNTLLFAACPQKCEPVDCCPGPVQCSKVGPVCESVPECQGGDGNDCDYAHGMCYDKFNCVASSSGNCTPDPGTNRMAQYLQCLNCEGSGMSSYACDNAVQCGPLLTDRLHPGDVRIYYGCETCW